MTVEGAINLIDTAKEEMYKQKMPSWTSSDVIVILDAIKDSIR